MTVRSEPTLAEVVADWVVGCGPTSVPAAVAERAGVHILDTVGVMAAGAGSPAGTTFRSWLLGRAGTPATASAVGIPDPVDAPTAALYNGICAHALDLDDQNYAVPGHSSTVVLPAVLAAAEDAGADGAALAAGFVVGTEVACRLGMALDPHHFQRGWHATATVGVFGAAAGCAAVYGCTAPEVVHALGLAAVHAGGIRANNPTMAKAYHVGQVAQAGVLSVQLAKAGVSASPTILEGRDGFAQTYNGGQLDPAPLHALGNPFALVEPGIMVKRYPACSGAAAAVDALLDVVRRTGLQPEDVRTVDCELTPLARAGMPNDQPETALAARFSLPYTLAAALLRGDVDIDAYTPETFADPGIHALAARVNVHTDPDAEWAPESGPEAATVTVHTSHGQTYEERRLQPHGAPADPLTREELEHKFLHCTRRVLADDDAAALLRDVAGLDRAAGAAGIAGVGARLRRVQPRQASNREPSR